MLLLIFFISLTIIAENTTFFNITSLIKLKNARDSIFTPFKVKKQTNHKYAINKKSGFLQKSTFSLYFCLCLATR